MRKTLFTFYCLLALAGGCPVQSLSAQEAEARHHVTMTIDATQKGPETSSYQYGLFFEEINHAGDGGLYAELIANRSFEDDDSWPHRWDTYGAASFEVTADNPLNDAQRNSLRLTAHDASEASPAGVVNEGFWGMNIVAGQTYQLTFFMRQNKGDFTGRLRARLLSEDLNTVCGEADVEGRPVTGQWVRLTATITATASDGKGRFALLSTVSGEMQLDVVSLFPSTWHDRPNGLRPDLAQLLADTHPSFLRFPGGCYVEGAGNSYDNAFQWKRTIGPIEVRPGHWNHNWGYRSSDGLGFDEYLQLCEDLGAAPLFVVNVGLGHDYFIPLDQMQPLVQDVLDAIEYANGDASTTWGARRIANGHAEPYGLKFIEIGNENYQSDWDVEQPGNVSYQYPERYEMYRQAISSRYPDIKLIGNVEAWGTDNPTWRNPHPVELVDEHYYRHYNWMRQNYRKYDNYDRSLGIKVYNGEYAANQGDYGQYGNVNSALGEAIYMLGMERNSDVCAMASFAPIFTHESDPCWPYDMIHFNAAGTFCTPSYYVQQLLPQYLGQQNLLWTEEGNLVNASQTDLHAGVATWNTASSFRDFTVTDADGRVLISDGFTDGWNFNSTGWQTADGMLRQTDIVQDCRAVNLTDINTDNYVVRLKARKNSGDEGFLIIFNYQDSENFCWWNLGGWNNTKHGVELCQDGRKSTIAEVEGSIEEGRWYDVEIQVRSMNVVCLLDGQEIHNFSLPLEQHIYQSVQLSDDASRLLVKVVNPGSEAIDLSLELKDMQATGGNIVCLKGQYGTDENTMEQPSLVVPTNGGTLGSDLSSITLPPFSLSILDIAVTEAQPAPHVIEPLHVDGRYLKNPKGNIVTLHGYEQVMYIDDLPELVGNVEAFLQHEYASIDSMIAVGWKMDYVRLMLATNWWINQYSADNTPRFELFKKYFEELCLPMIDFLHSRGIYTLLWGIENSNFPSKQEQQRMLLYWDYISSHPRIRNNPGVMLELHNEPDYDDAVYEDFGKAWTDWMQPVVDKIRSHCDNVIFVPTIPQAMTGFVDYPLKGGNIGYQSHYYPGFDFGKGIEKDWDTGGRLTLSNFAPLIITELAWFGDREGSGGDVSYGTTTDFGKPLKEVMDKYGNVSWNSYMPNLDYYYKVNQPSEDGTLDWWNDPESCFVPLFDWYKEYAKTNPLPVSQLKAKNVTLGDVPTDMQPGDTYSLKIMAEFTNGITWNVAGDAVYTVSAPGVLTVAHGNIRVLKEGAVTVDVKYTDGTGQTFDRQFQVVSAGELPTTRVFADSKAVWYGDELPALTFTTLDTNLTGTPQLATTASSTSPAGDYPITISQGTISDPNVKYIEGELRILPAPLDVTLHDATINEGDTPDVTFTYNGFRNGDTQGSTLKKEPAMIVSQEGHTFETAKLNSHLPAGFYLITGRDGEAKNYDLCYNIARLTVEENLIDGTNLTDKVGTTAEDWHAWGMTDTQYAPAVTTCDGRTSQMAETYESTTETTGELMWQEVTDLPNGDYVVELFANAAYTPGRGFDSSVAEGAEDVAFIEANGQRTYLGARIGEAMPWNEFYSVSTTVTDGKLRISMVAEKPGTNWHTIQIKRLVRLPDPEPEDEDLTARVDVSQESWNAWGVCATEYAPAITTSDGRWAQMMETYEETVGTTGEMMWQTITGLEPGDYAVEFYANAQYTDGRGFSSDLRDGATDVAYVSANDRRCYLTAHVGIAASENGVYTVYAHVADGTLRLGLTAEKPGTNWHTLQIKKLTLLRRGTVVYADDKMREQGMANPQWTYTASGAAVTGRPSLTCAATSASPLGCYVISIATGSLRSDLPIYLQPGVLTVTASSGVDEVTVGSPAAPLYDLQGRRVEARPAGGIYITSGRKVIMKNHTKDIVK